MKKRIYAYMLICSFLCITVITLLLSFVFYELVSKNEQKEIQTNAIYIAGMLDLQNDKAKYLVQTPQQESYRITLVDEGGKVLFDNYMDISSMDNHAQRPEIEQAVRQNTGEYKRFSGSLDTETYYYAIKLADGKILRLAKTTESISSIFFSALPALAFAVFLALAVCFMVSKRLTKKIIQPINALQLDNENTEVYEEISPLINKINEQKMQISAQMSELEKRADTIQSIIQNMHEGLVFIDTEANILAINQSAITLLQAEKSDYIGKSILLLTREPEIIENIKKSLSGSKKSFAIAIRGRNLDIYTSPVLAGADSIGCIAILVDATEKALAEKMRREFSANVSHELKTPLTSILGFSEIIENGMAQKDDITDFAGRIKSEVVRLISLIENIIKISEFDEKEKIKNFTVFDLRALAEETVQTLALSAQDKSVNISLSGDRFDITADRTMMSELLSNLIENAIKYNKPNGSVEVDLLKSDDHIKITVKDTGIGIADEHLYRVFERFYRADPSRSKKTGGSGLGLSIVKHIAQYHGGDVQIKSIINEGTSVIVELENIITT